MKSFCKSVCSLMMAAVIALPSFVCAAGVAESFTISDMNKELGGLKSLPVMPAKRIVVDAKGSDWAGYPEVTIPTLAHQLQTFVTGEFAKDLTAVLKTAYDSKYFYFYLEVNDDVHVYQDDANYWQSDSVQFVLSEVDDSFGYEIGMIYDSDEKKGKIHSTALTAEQAKSINCAAGRDGNVTKYEAAIPWDIYHHGKVPGDMLFNLLVNENDGAGRVCCVELAPGISFTKSNAQYPHMEMLSGDKDWYCWIEGERRPTVQKAADYNLYLINNGGNKAFKVSAAGVDFEPFSVGTGYGARKSVPVAFEEDGGAVVRFTVEADGKLYDVSYDVAVLSLKDVPPKYVVTTNFKGSPKNSRAFTWNTTEAEDTVVEYFEGEDVSAAKILSAAGSGRATLHKAEITNLKPGTVYSYRVGDGTDRSDWKTFVTEAEDSGTPFTFTHITDTQGGATDGANWFKRTITAAVGKVKDIKFFVHTGDVVDDGASREQYKYLFEQGQGVIDSIPMMTVPGNHDHMDGSANFIKYFNFPDNGKHVSGNESKTYSFDYGAAHFVGIDSNYLTNEENSIQIAQWLKADLAGTDKPWKVAYLHHGPYVTLSYTQTLVTNARKFLVPVFDEYGVDLVLCGHDHHYARSYLMNGVVTPLAHPGEDAPDLSLYPQILGSADSALYSGSYGTLYMMGNSTGSKVYNYINGEGGNWMNNLPWFDKISQPYKGVFTAYTVTEDTMTATAYTVDTHGSTAVYDEFTLRKRVKGSLADYARKVYEIFDSRADSSEKVAIANTFGVSGEDCTVVIAAYGADGTLAGARTGGLSAAAGEELSVTVTYAGIDADYIKAFLFMNLSGVQ